MLQIITYPILLLYITLYNFIILYILLYAMVFGIICNYIRWFRFFFHSIANFFLSFPILTPSSVFNSLNRVEETRY